MRDEIEQAVQIAGGIELPTGLCVQVGAGQLISPEGRLTIEILEQTLAEQVGEWLELAVDDISRAEHYLLDVYRAWTRERLNKVVTLTAGESTPLLPAPIGLVVMLLIEDAVGPERGLPRGTPGSNSDRDRAVVAATAAFAVELDGRSPHLDLLALYSGYAVSEARRRLPALGLDAAESDDDGKLLYIKEGCDQDVVAFLGRELARRKVRPSDLTRAMAAMLSAYRDESSSERAERAALREPGVRRRLLAALRFGPNAG